MTVNTKHAPGRRELHFQSLEEMLREVEELAASSPAGLGNWTPGQVFLHLARTMDMSIDGHSPAPWFIRLLVKLPGIKRKFLSRPMPAGFRLPKQSQDLVPGETTTEAGLNAFRSALDRLQRTSERAPHPAFGPLTQAEWDQLHLRHAELHLGFLVRGE